MSDLANRRDLVNFVGILEIDCFKSFQELYKRLITIFITTVSKSTEKAYQEEVLLPKGESFLFRRDRYEPAHSMGFHFHKEIEIQIVIRGAGIRKIGDSISAFKSGEVVIIPPFMPHAWMYDSTESHCERDIEEICFQFPNNLASGHESMPELSDVNEFLQTLDKPFVIFGDCARHILDAVENFELKKGLDRLLSLLGIINRIITSKEYTILFSHDFNTNRDIKSNTKFREILEYIENHYTDKINLKDLAEATGMSNASICRMFKKYMNLSFVEYVNLYRLREACSQLSSTTKNISEIAYSAGFNDIPNFNRLFLKVMGVSPTEYRNHVIKV